MSDMQEAVEPIYCEGVQLLLQRMESHPKEFEIDSGKWGSTMRVVYERTHNAKVGRVVPEPWLTQEEVWAVWGKYKEIKQQEFHEFVMKKLFEEEAAPKERMQLSGTGVYGITNLQPGEITPITLAGNTTIQGTLDAEPSPALIQKIKNGLGL